jgi:hypothetical protein
MKTRVVHSESKNSWKIIGTILGGRYNYARVDYLVIDDDAIDAVEKADAYRRALRISKMFNEEN